MDQAEPTAVAPPNHILGYAIRSRTRIYVSYLIPAALELLVFIAQLVADCAVSYEHFRSHQPGFGCGTLILILIPPLLTFVFILSSKEQWANPRHANRCHFVGYQLLQMLLFPFFAIYRFMVRVFWSIEALFHEDDDRERMLCLERSAESSTCELYNLIQAYGQSAPQIILQLYHMLTQDLFRNFETTNAQALSLIFSAIDLAAVTTSYQRFESQRQVGRMCPWSPPQEIDAHRRMLEQNERLRSECERKKRDSERTIASFPESEKIMTNFKRTNTIRAGSDNRNSEISEPLTHEVEVRGFDEIDNEGTPPQPEETVALIHNASPGTLPRRALTLSINGPGNATDDDKIRTSPKVRLQSIREELQINFDYIEVLDTVPDSPPPPLPTLPANVRSVGVQTSLLRAQFSQNSETDDSMRRKRASNTFSQLDTFKDMFIVNAQLYIKEHVKRPPKMFITRVEEEPAPAQQELAVSPTTPLTPKDVVDFFLPRPTKIVNGIQQDDFAGKTIAFFGWISFIIMRMLSLATFCVFFPRAFFILVSVHYLVMLVALHLETRFRGKLNRTLFYLLLAYVYIFVLLEFRIKFKRIRLWLVGYFVLTMVENITMTAIWYAREDFESWWFGFIFEGIIYSGILFVATLLVYYYYLKPKDVTLILEDDGNKEED